MGDSDSDVFSMMFNHLMEKPRKVSLDFFYLRSGFESINDRLYKYINGDL